MRLRSVPALLQSRSLYVPALKKAIVPLTKNTALTPYNVIRTAMTSGTRATVDMHHDVPSPYEQLKHELKGVPELWGGVPRPAMICGLAGVIPYAFTTLSTLYLTWSATKASHSSFAMAPDLAHQYLAMLQPIQIGYGAVLLSFLGAIHWGLEFSGYGGNFGYKRYLYGIVTPALAWPTLLLTPNIALIAQFLSFTGLYYADTKACTKGWTPSWYGNYRFVLTFIVCTALVTTIIMRGWMEDPKTGDHLKHLREVQYGNMIHQTKIDMQARPSDTRINPNPPPPTPANQVKLSSKRDPGEEERQNAYYSNENRKVVDDKQTRLLQQEANRE